MPMRTRQHLAVVVASKIYAGIRFGVLMQKSRIGVDMQDLVVNEYIEEKSSIGALDT